MSQCLNCGTDIFEHELTKFCINCGQRVDINTCSNESCTFHKDSVQLPEHAKYCPVCKSTTTYFANEPF